MYIALARIAFELMAHTDGVRHDWYASGVLCLYVYTCILHGSSGIVPFTYTLMAKQAVSVLRASCTRRGFVFPRSSSDCFFVVTCIVSVHHRAHHHEFSGWRPWWDRESRNEA